MIPVSEPLLGGNELRYVQDCLDTGWISSSGDYIDRFERAWAAYCGTEHGIAVSNGTAALQLAVDSLRLKPEDEVVLPSFTIISCALAVLRAGATPVLVDCDPRTYCMDVEKLAAAVTPRTRAIMPVHIYGHSVDMDPLTEVAERHGLAVIEDAAEAHGSEYFSANAGRWRRCGGLGTLAAFSFYANKPITTGEGGMVLTNDAALAEHCRSARDLCRKERRFYHEELGYNYRLTNIQAAIGTAQVERVSEILARKRDVAKTYDALMSSIRGMVLPPRSEWSRVNHCMYPVLLDDDVEMDAAMLATRLKDQGVETRPFFLGMHEQPVFRARGLFAGLRLPVTERLYRRGLYLPCGLTITREQIEFVASTLRDLLA
jgi:perosamine synthetase